MVTGDKMNIDVGENYNIYDVQIFDNKIYLYNHNILKSINLDESKLENLVNLDENYIIRTVYITDEYVFFTTYNEYKNNVLDIYRVKNDGNDLVKIYSIEYPEQLSNIVGDRIFIVNKKIIFFDTNFIIDNKHRIKVLDFDGNELNWDMWLWGMQYK